MKELTNVVGALQCKAGTYLITREYYNTKQSQYPRIDLKLEFANMWNWLDANPRKRKTERGMNRFITSWLNTARSELYGKTTIDQNIKHLETMFTKSREARDDKILGIDENEIW